MPLKQHKSLKSVFEVCLKIEKIFRLKSTLLSEKKGDRWYKINTKLSLLILFISYKH